MLAGPFRFRQLEISVLKVTLRGSLSSSFNLLSREATIGRAVLNF